jgi:PAS domain S-box-containing protein
MMVTNRDNLATAADFRRCAEERLKSQPIVALSEAQTQQLVHELQIHQIELEMQNEQLNASRDKLDAALYKSELTLRLLFAKMPVGIYTCDAEGFITSFNQRAVEVWGREPKINDPADRFCGSLRLFAPDGSPIPHEQCWIALALRDNKEYCECEIIVERSDGSRRFLLADANPLHDSSGKLIGALNIVVDITEQKRPELALGHSEQRLNLAVAAADLGFFEHTFETEATYWSPRLRRIFGWNDEEPASLPAYLELTHPQDRARVTAAVQNARDPAGTGHYRVEHRIVTRDGAVRWINVLSRTTFAGIGNERHAVVNIGTIADITDLKQAENNLRESESELQASSDRLSSLSRQLIAAHETERRHLARELHDEIGQVLSAISINLKTLHRKVDPALRAPLEESMSIVDRAVQQVRDLSLDLRPAMLDDFGLEAALRWYATRYAERTGVTAHITTRLTRPDLSEMVRNTCFRLAQETLTNVLRHATARQVWIDLQQVEDDLILTIRDDGQGFNVPLARTRATRGGSLGLINMQERVELLGGQLDIESQPGAGAVVRARLPVPHSDDTIQEGAEGAEP